MRAEDQKLKLIWSGLTGAVHPIAVLQPHVHVCNIKFQRQWCSQEGFSLAPSAMTPKKKKIEITHST